MFLLALGAGCVPSDVPPSVLIVSPTDQQGFDGQASIPVRLQLSDDRSHVGVELFLDGEPVGSSAATGCKSGCSVSLSVPTADLPDGQEHELTAIATDVHGGTAEAEPVVFTVHDIPYVHSLAVSGTQEPLLDNTFEVEVHLLHDATATWRGCAALPEVQQDGLLYEDLRGRFVGNQAGAVVRFADVSFDVFRVVVIESDGGRHCPSWPELTEDFQSGVDDLYGISPPVDFAALYTGALQPNVANVSGLEIRRGRPFGQ